MASRKGRTVTVAERPIHAQFNALMLAGRIWSWSAPEHDEWFVFETADQLERFAIAYRRGYADLIAHREARLVELTGAVNELHRDAFALTFGAPPYVDVEQAGRWRFDDTLARHTRDLARRRYEFVVKSAHIATLAADVRTRRDRQARVLATVPVPTPYSFAGVKDFLLAFDPDGCVWHKGTTAKRTDKGQLVALTRRLVAAARNGGIHDGLLAEADGLLAAA